MEAATNDAEGLTKGQSPFGRIRPAGEAMGLLEDLAVFENGMAICRQGHKHDRWRQNQNRRRGSGLFSGFRCPSKIASRTQDIPAKVPSDSRSQNQL